MVNSAKPVSVHHQSIINGSQLILVSYWKSDSRRGKDGVLLALIRLPCFALSYNIQDCNVNNDHFDKLNVENVADVILVKKHYGDRSKRRAWKLKHIPRDDTSIGSVNKDYAAFLDDLEEDPVYRQNINIYRDPSKPIPVDINDVQDEPCIRLDEMLEEMRIDEDTEMKE